MAKATAASKETKVGNNNNNNKDEKKKEAICVHLWIADSSLSLFANAIGEQLAARYGIHQVLVRSADIPVSQLLSSTTTDPSSVDQPLLLYVFVGPPTFATSVLERESSIPLLTIPHTVTSTTTTAAVPTEPSASSSSSSSLTREADEVALTIAKHCSLASTSLRQTVRDAVMARNQARIIQDVQLKTESYLYRTAIANCYDANNQITGDDIVLSANDTAASNTTTLPERQRGKVRDRYETSDSHRVALVTTDRQSGFDRILAQVPFKGAVLNLTSAYWFQATAHIIPNHAISIPHPYVTVAHKCRPFPIEFVVRAYLTGSTSTSIWKHYQNGVRNYCGHDLPDGMVKNQPLSSTLLTPTTKETDHDRPISAEDILKEEWMTAEDFQVCATAALEIFKVGQELAARRGLILVDTKYEFGRHVETGEILLIDEVHTPDSSRYWLASTYPQRMEQGLEPDNIDKEFLRLWFRQQCDPYNHKEPLPEAPRDLVVELSRRYILLYELISGQSFDFATMTTGEAGIQQVLQQEFGVQVNKDK